jgi:SMI1 / KNR4 family (SUKH-1)
MQTVETIKLKHDNLKKLDGGSFFKSANYKTFGSETHNYKFNSCLTETELNNFEKNFSISLPTDYRNFLKKIGNGGSGPYYGLFSLNNWNYELEIQETDFLSINFPYTEKWNITQNFDTSNNNYFESEEFLNWENEYFANSHITGSLRICDYGCAVYFLLIISGNEKGNIWIDDRANDGGIYPVISKVKKSKMNFIEWYEEWLDENTNNIK